MPNPRDDSRVIALEHFRWARSQGFTNDEILQSIGVRPVLAPDDWTVLKHLAAAHRQLLDRTRRAA
jgi:hypothetical protein